jgi:hypothetical protein
VSSPAHIDAGDYVIRLTVHDIPDGVNELVSADCLTFHVQGGLRE